MVMLQQSGAGCTKMLPADLPCANHAVIPSYSFKGTHQNKGKDASISFLLTAVDYRANVNHSVFILPRLLDAIIMIQLFFLRDCMSAC